MPRLKRHSVTHKSTGGMLTSIPAPVDPVGNAVTSNTVALPVAGEAPFGPMIHRRFGRACRRAFGRADCSFFAALSERVFSPLPFGATRFFATGRARFTLRLAGRAAGAGVSADSLARGIARPAVLNDRFLRSALRSPSKTVSPR